MFGVSRMVRGGKRLDMEHVANSTVAGGVVVRALLCLLCPCRRPKDLLLPCCAPTTYIQASPRLPSVREVSCIRSRLVRTAHSLPIVGLCLGGPYLAQIGTACDMISNPGGAVLCGVMAGTPRPPSSRR